MLWTQNLYEKNNIQKPIKTKKSDLSKLKKLSFPPLHGVDVVTVDKHWQTVHVPA